ncbi:MAG: MOSC domain-containing protein [Bacteroidia bacterium]
MSIKFVLRMKVVATNVGKSRSVEWKGKKVTTGIFKYPNFDGIALGITDVEEDNVVDRKYHGGVDKACYMYSADSYQNWKLKYPDLEWDYGMFGENLSIDGLDEREIYIGDVYKVGEALVEVSEPREPCFKLGIRFGTQEVLKDFINTHHCGVYVRVLESGRVNPGDDISRVTRVQNEFSIARIYWLRYNARLKDFAEVRKAMKLDSLAPSAKRGLAKRLMLLK